MKKSDDSANVQPFDYFVLNFSKLMPGDVILTSSPGELVSELIKLVTLSEYSHAILVLELPYAVESSDYGVIKFRLDRFAVRDPKNVKILRLREDIRNQFNVKSALNYTSKQLTKKYADIAVYFCLLRSVPRLQSGKYFCSQLVAEAYQQGGIEIAPGTKPKNISPKALSDSKVFDQVPNCFMLKAVNDLGFVPALLDATNPRSPAEAEATLRQKVVDAIKKDFEKQGIVIYDFYKALMELCILWEKNDNRYVKLDKIFAEAIVSSGLMQLNSKIYPAHCDIFFIDFYVRNAIISGEMGDKEINLLINSMNEEYNRMKVTFMERHEDVSALKVKYMDSGLETVRLHLANCWECLWTAKRIMTVYERVISGLQLSSK